MRALPERIINTGPYRYTRNPMYLGHLIFLFGLAILFWSIFGLTLFAVRCVWFHRRVLHDEERLRAQFGFEYASYRAEHDDGYRVLFDTVLRKPVLVG